MAVLIETEWKGENGSAGGPIEACARFSRAQRAVRQAAPDTKNPTHLSQDRWPGWPGENWSGSVAETGLRQRAALPCRTAAGQKRGANEKTRAAEQDRRILRCCTGGMFTFYPGCG